MSAIAGGDVITTVFYKSPETATLHYATHEWQGKVIYTSLKLYYSCFIRIQLLYYIIV
jgi:hypothetical protein